MRIVSGQYKGRSLIAPVGLQVRPTTDRVRESLFNVLAHGLVEMEGARVLDLFAGSGALGLEALSRGAIYVHFVEKDAAARGAIRANIEALGAAGKSKILKRDATNLGARFQKRGEACNIIFLDPPYGLDLGPKALKSVIEGDWLAQDATVVFECGKDEIPDLPGFTLEDERIYGDTKVLFLTYRS